MNSCSNLAWLASILFVLTIVQAYVYVIPNAKHPEQEGHCYYGELKISVPINDSLQLPGRCEQVSCFGDYEMEVVGCGIVSGRPGEKVTEKDYTKSYPDCCADVVKE